MAQRVQPGGRVDEATYERFREFVKQQHGAVRGNLGRELEKAMRERMDVANGRDSMTRIENDVATIKAMLADADADGGAVAPTPSEPSDTHARETTKPAANQPRADKIDYLIEIYLDRNATEDGGVLVEGQVQSIVKDEYAFDDEILDDYVEAVYDRVKDRFPVEPHPLHGKFHVWGDQLERAKEKAEEIAQEEMEGVE